MLFQQMFYLLETMSLLPYLFVQSWCLALDLLTLDRARIRDMNDHSEMMCDN